jgi:CRISPR-associated endonuclease Cas3-HD
VERLSRQKTPDGRIAGARGIGNGFGGAMMYYAHSPKGDIPAQSYQAHICKVVEEASKFAVEVGQYAARDAEFLKMTVQQAAFFHDLGKLNEENQKVLSGERPGKPPSRNSKSSGRSAPGNGGRSGRSLPRNHVDAGTALLFTDSHFSPFSAIAICAHHKGFRDFIKESNKQDRAFRDPHIMADVDGELQDLVTLHNSLVHTDSFSTHGEPCLPGCSGQKRGAASPGNDYAHDAVQGDKSVFLRILLSCLADADHTDTAIHYGKHPETEQAIPLRPAERLRKLDTYVADMKKDDGDDDERVVLRREMYAACRDAVAGAGICSCDSPVGSGKTTAVMADLLAQADKRGLRRIFVVLPFTNIISQSVKIYRNALVLPGEKAEDVVAELHHRADFQDVEARQLTALWKAPIIVTTAVAFFETLASNSPATLRRLHKLPGSAIFIDESHAALPAKLLPLAWRWINIYAEEWGCYWVLASGSLSRFWHIKEIAGDGPSAEVPEIVRGDLRGRLSGYEKQRIAYRYDPSPKSLSELAEWVIRFPGPRLVILNTVQNAAGVADYFCAHYGREKIEHLSTALTAADREKTLERVRQRLKSDKDTDWSLIATSCVEAGVDLSFRTGFRELASLVSLLQAAGRINRGGFYSYAEIWTFCLAVGGMINTNPELKNAAAVLRGYLEKGKSIEPGLSTESIDDEIKLYGLSAAPKLTKYEQVQRFPLVEDDFKVIKTDTRIAVVDEDFAKQIQHDVINWHVLQKNSVQIAKYKLDEVGSPEIIPGIHHWELKYDDFLGYMAGIVQLKKLEGEGMIV